MVEHPELAEVCLDEAAFPPHEDAQRRIWGQLEKDLEELGRALGRELSLRAASA
jgi:hypothetical protein